MNIELLAPAGDFLCFKEALYNGADAIYLASDMFGARAYAKNLTLDELEKAILLAHQMGKKVYVTVNTILKEKELESCKEYIKKLYYLNVDGLILADFAVIPYVTKNFPLMESHVSTQAGIKTLDDIKFFKELNVKRCVLARENTIDDIKEFKKNVDMPLEVFAYGALCVSLSGGCLFSSCLTKRSGNRGRCAQNCRRNYEIYKDSKLLAKDGFHLSMRDLNTIPNLNELIDAKVDSLKIEGRMKSPEYVKTVVSEFRKKIDDLTYEPKYLDKVFHRNYTKGFLFHEDNGKIVDLSKRTNEGEFIGLIDIKVGNLTKIKLDKKLKLGDRIRIEDTNSFDYYFTVDKIYDLKNKEILESENTCLLNIYKDFDKGFKIYKMSGFDISLDILDTYKRKIVVEVCGKLDSKLTLKTKVDNICFIGESNLALSRALNKPLDKDTLFKQINKFKDTSFHLLDIINNLEGNLFIPLSEINLARRNLVENMNSYFGKKREIGNILNPTLERNINENKDIILTAFCKTDEQYKAIKDSNIDIIYYKNYSPYYGNEEKFNEDYVLVGNYGGIYKHKGKDIICDYSFNALNSEAILNLINNGANLVTLSYESDLENLKNIYNSFKNNYNIEPPIEMIVYGHQNLMTLKYCPLKRYGECKDCMNHTYYLKDSKAKFPLIHKNCITNILNDKTLNLVDDLKEITKYVKRIRLEFTTESYDETLKVINMYKEKLNNIDLKTNHFDSKKDTRGYLKNPIL